LFVLLAVKGNDLVLFSIAVIGDNLAAGMGTTALVAFIMRIVDKRHTAIWSNLYSKLSQEEANALFYALEEKKFEPDENIIKQGELNLFLLFVEKGEIRVFYTIKDKNIFVQNLGQGSVAGRETFFSTSVSTVSMSAVCHTQVHCLNKDYIAKWKNNLPLLESKLNDFCSQQDKISNSFSGKKLNRRVDERFSVTGSITFRVLKPDGTLMDGNFRGALSDISKGGLSFLIKSASKDTANRLLGRKIKMSSQVKVNEHVIGLDHVGIVTAVDFKPLISLSSNDYIIHVKTDEKIRF
jgi:CRP-like cAMP-binding protein